MRYLSTRDQTKTFSLSEALEKGLAPDGGLFIPEHFFPVSEFDSQLGYAEFGAKLLCPFFEGDELQKKLSNMCKLAFNFPIKLRFRKDQSPVLELFHGPTAAFKDVGARFLAQCFDPSDRKRSVLVATSGDTGGAVASAFLSKKNIEVLILYPKGKISLRQEKQITAWGENIKAFSVNGNFDDCQKIVKDALADPEWKKEKTFISANSISIGRLLPQMIYYAKSSLEYLSQLKCAPGYIIPTGNLGNAVAALYAKRLGFPIGKIVLATNANHSIVDFLKTGVWTPNKTISTLANAMDVGNPSNIERLRSLYPNIVDLRTDVSAISVSDTEISEMIRNQYKSSTETFCPHTATALVAEKKAAGKNWIIVATAHPAKFESIVEPLIGRSIEVPETLKALLNRPSVFEEIEAYFSDFKSRLSL